MQNFAGLRESISRGYSEAITPTRKSQRNILRTNLNPAQRRVHPDISTALPIVFRTVRQPAIGLSEGWRCIAACPASKTMIERAPQQQASALLIRCLFATLNSMLTQKQDLSRETHDVRDARVALAERCRLGRSLLNTKIGQSTYFVSYTVFPPRTVRRTLVPRICAGATCAMSRSRTTKSARYPGTRIPFVLSSNSPYAEPQVYA